MWRRASRASTEPSFPIGGDGAVVAVQRRRLMLSQRAGRLVMPLQRDEGRDDLVALLVRLPNDTGHRAAVRIERAHTLLGPAAMLEQSPSTQSASWRLAHTPCSIGRGEWERGLARWFDA